MTSTHVEKRLTRDEVEGRHEQLVQLFSSQESISAEIDGYRRDLRAARRQLRELDTRVRVVSREIRSGVTLVPRQQALPDPGIDAMTDEPAPEIDPPGPPSRHGPGPLLDAVELRHLVTCVRPKQFWPTLKEVQGWHPEVRADVQRWCRTEHGKAHPIAGQPVPHDFTIPNVLENVEFARAAKAKKPRGARPLANGRKKVK